MAKELQIEQTFRDGAEVEGFFVFGVSLNSGTKGVHSCIQLGA